MKPQSKEYSYGMPMYSSYAKNQYSRYKQHRPSRRNRRHEGHDSQKEKYARKNNSNHKWDSHDLIMSFVGSYFVEDISYFFSIDVLIWGKHRDKEYTILFWNI